MDKYRVLVVDDDREIAEAIGIYLTQAGFEPELAFDGEEALHKLQEDDYHLVIMDIMMPRMGGIKAVAKIRETDRIPILFLSAKSEDADKILGLDMGADDYITKPFNPLELVARVRSHLRRYTHLGGAPHTATEGHIISSRSLSMDLEKKATYVDGEEVRLTAIEYKILKLLLRNAGRIFSIDEIFEKVWNEPNINGDNTVAVHIRRIREKIEINPREPEYLKVVWGIGYKIEKY